MDPRRFDSLARSIAAPKTRRGLLGTLAAFGAGLGGARAGDAQVSQAQCGNKVCASNPGVCTGGCVCCAYSNGNSRCLPPTKCTAPGTVATTTTTLPPPTIRMFPILQGLQCTATFFADYFPAGDFDVTLVRDGGPPELLNEVIIDAGEVVQEVLVHTYLLAPGIFGSITVADGAFSLTFGFEFSCE